MGIEAAHEIHAGKRIDKAANLVTGSNRMRWFSETNIGDHTQARNR